MPDRTCSTEGCDRTAQRRGLCNVHYRRQLAARAPACSTEGCGNPAKTRGWCMTHYDEWRRSDDAGLPACSIEGCDRTSRKRGKCGPHYRSEWLGNAPACSADGCDRPAESRGWCSTHYARWRLHGSAADPAPFIRPPCAVDGCDTLARTRGWCPTHYNRWVNHGTTDGPTLPQCPPGPRPPCAADDDYFAYISRLHRRMSESGYVLVRLPDHPLVTPSTGYVLEHRMIAWDLGMFADPDLHVHHINHVKTDNRPDNLWALSKADHRRIHNVEHRSARGRGAAA